MGSVYDLRGTHGSGKSHVVHTILKTYEHWPIVEYEGQLEWRLEPDMAQLEKQKAATRLGYFLPEIDLGIIGDYSKVCGGCDGIKTADEVVRRIRLFSRNFERTLLEGVLVAHTFTRYKDLALELGNYHFLFLDTPLPTCISRVRARRWAKGNEKPLDPKNVARDHARTQRRLPAEFAAAGCATVRIRWRNSVAGVLAAMGVAAP